MGLGGDWTETAGEPGAEDTPSCPWDTPRTTVEYPECWAGVGSVLASTGEQVEGTLAKEWQVGTGGYGSGT